MRHFFQILLLLLTCSLIGCAFKDDGLLKSKSDSDTDTYFTASNVSVTEGNTATFTLTLNEASDSTVSVSYATADSTAQDGVEYTAASGTLVFSPGETSKSFTVSTIEDVVPESQKFFRVLFSGSGFSTSLSPSLVTGIIVDDDIPTTSGTIHVLASSGNEGDAIFVEVVLAAASSSTVTVDYATSNGTATIADSDYTAASGTLTFSPGQTSKTFVIYSTEDTHYETDEDVTVTLSGGSNYTVAGSTLSTSTTIINDDSVPTISIANDTEDEGTALVFTATLSNRSYQTVTIDYATSNGTATTADSDYTSTSGTLTFVPGDTSEDVTVNTTTDTKYENTETLTVTLSGGSNYTSTGSDLTATGTITNEDAVPTISIAAASGNEGANVVFTVTQDRTSAFTTTFDYASSGGTATSGTDFTATSGSTSITAGNTTVTISVPATQDATEETDETFTMTISNPANATITTAAETGTVVDNVLFYDFLTAALPADTTFTRNSTGTYFDVNGNIVSAGANTARFEYDPTNCPLGVCALLGLLMEPAATNLIVRSAEFDSASWTKSNALAIAGDNGDSATPDGVNTNGELLRENNNFSSHYVEQAIGTAVAAGSLVHFTVYAKNYGAAPRNYLRLRVSSGGNNIIGFYDLTGVNSPTTSSAGNGGGQLTASMHDVGNGWYRLRLSGVASTSGTALTARINLLSSFAGGITYFGDNTSGVQLWGAQLEADSSLPTSYIPTTNATVIRQADMLTSDLFTGFSGSFGDGTNWTMITDFSRPLYEPTSTAATPKAAEFCISASCSNDRISSRFSTAAETFGTESYIGGASQGSSLTGAISGVSNTVYQLGVVKTAGVIQTYLNGTAYTASGSLSYPAVDTLYVGGSSYAGSELNGHLRKFTLRPRSVPNAQMLTLTSD